MENFFPYYLTQTNLKPKIHKMITLEKLLNELKPDSLNEIVAGLRDSGGSAGDPGNKGTVTIKTNNSSKSNKSNKRNKSNKKP